ncbi:glycosyltransferase [Algoriphagus litoralis]|uniref:glycosyltransferase n=1 Tax=Algoriphagus litoralis TaxID=2202829 RepID=UPI000DB9BE7D|nr:glycosyltransferase [Algoriphagus litoralis]
MINKILVSIIIPTFREWDLLRSCLEALAKQSFPMEKVEIIVVNNDPNNPKPEDLILEPNVTLLTQPRPGSYAARNMGLDHSQGQYLAFTDSDCIPNTDWLSQGIRLLEGRFDLVGGKMEFFKPEGGDHQAFLFESRFSFRQDRNVLQNKQSITANLFVKKTVFQDVGPFDESLMSGGDYEWTRRATDAGYTIAYGDKAIVRHPSRKNFQALINKKKRTSGGMYFSFFRSYSPIRKLSFTLWILRPPITIFGFNNLSLKEKIILFQARWYLEWVGVKEMADLHFSKKSARRE